MKILVFLKRAALGLVGLVVLWASSFAVLFWLGGNDVKTFCSEAKSSFPVSELAALAKKHGVSIRLPGVREDTGAYLALANTWRSSGRHTCLVRHDNINILISQYGYVD